MPQAQRTFTVAAGVLAAAGMTIGTGLVAFAAEQV